jgi:hypothetical protein
MGHNLIFAERQKYMHAFSRFACSLLALAPAGMVLADDVNVGPPLPRFALLKEGVHRYLRFMKAGEASTPADIWTRELRFEERDGKRLLRIRQRWDGVAPAPSVRLIDSWFEAGSFRPLTHERITEREGKRVVEGFAFAPGRITGLQGLADNTQKDLAVDSPEPTFNFETDIEFLQALPLAPGYEARINFYHPGGPTPPQRYTFKVSGAATIAGPAGPVDCWVVTTDYNKPGSVSTFWFAKGTQLMLRQESKVGERTLVKALIE